MLLRAICTCWDTVYYVLYRLLIALFDMWNMYIWTIIVTIIGIISVAIDEGDSHQIISYGHDTMVCYQGLINNN